jgi:hypothetical protein
MDEATVAKALQSDLNSHKVKIQVKWVGIQLYILASREQEHYVNYEFLFSLIQSRLDQLRIPSIENFTLYGKASADPEPEWKKVGLISQHPSLDRQIVDTLVVVNGKVENIKSEYDLSRVYPQSTKLVNDLPPPQKSNRKLHKASKTIVNLLTLSVAIASVAVMWVIWERSQHQDIINQAKILNAQIFNLNQPHQLVKLEDELQSAKEILAGLKGIPNRPFADYTEAQAQIPLVANRVAKIEQKLVIERNAVASLDSAQKLALTAVAIAKNPPHKPQVWRLAQKNWAESLQIVRAIPLNTSTAMRAQESAKIYRDSYKSVSFQLERQLMEDAIAYFLKTETGMGIQVEMRELKSAIASRNEFMNVCTPFASFNLDPNQVTKQQVSLAALSVEMCSYLWARK